MAVSIPLRLEESPTRREVERSLGRLCTRAVRTYWILEVGRPLLGLDCVRQYLPTNAHSERDYAIALRRYLEDAVQRVDSLQYRTLLEVILGVGDEDWKAK